MKVGKVLVGLGIAATTVWGFRAPNAKLFVAEDLARILFWHLPCAFLTVVFLIAGACYSFSTLRAEGHWSKDAKAEAANELAFVFGLITMATGILFSRA